MSSCSMEIRVHGDKRKFFIPAKQPWRGWHEDYFACCWRHIKRCDWSSDIFSRHGCLRPGSKTLFKPLQEHLVHLRDREEPSRNPASSNLSSFRPRESGCSASLKWSRQHWLFFRKRQGNMLESFHRCWWWNHRLSFSARENIINSQWRHMALIEKLVFSSSTYPKQRCLQWAKWDGGYLERNKLSQKGFPQPRQLYDKPS